MPAKAQVAVQIAETQRIVHHSGRVVGAAEPPKAQ